MHSNVHMCIWYILLTLRLETYIKKDGYLADISSLASDIYDDCYCLLINRYSEVLHPELGQPFT